MSEKPLGTGGNMDVTLATTACFAIFVLGTLSFGSWLTAVAVIMASLGLGLAFEVLSHNLPFVYGPALGLLFVAAAPVLVPVIKERSPLDPAPEISKQPRDHSDRLNDDTFSENDLEDDDDDSTSFLEVTTARLLKAQREFERARKMILGLPRDLWLEKIPVMQRLNSYLHQELLTFVPEGFPTPLSAAPTAIVLRVGAGVPAAFLAILLVLVHRRANYIVIAILALISVGLLVAKDVVRKYSRDTAQLAHLGYIHLLREIEYSSSNGRLALEEQRERHSEAMRRLADQNQERLHQIRAEYEKKLTGLRKQIKDKDSLVERLQKSHDFAEERRELLQETYESRIQLVLDEKEALLESIERLNRKVSLAQARHIISERDQNLVSTQRDKICRIIQTLGVADTNFSCTVEKITQEIPPLDVSEVVALLYELERRGLVALDKQAAEDDDWPVGAWLTPDWFKTIDAQERRLNHNDHPRTVQNFNAPVSGTFNTGEIVVSGATNPQVVDELIRDGVSQLVAAIREMLQTRGDLPPLVHEALTEKAQSLEEEVRSRGRLGHLAQTATEALNSVPPQYADTGLAHATRNLLKTLKSVNDSLVNE